MTEQPLRFLANHEMASLEPNGPYSDSSSANVFLLRMVAPSLVTVDVDLSLKPALAESWRADDECRRFTFQLRPGLKFHNGRPLTAESVVWNFNRIVDGRVGSRARGDFALLEEVVALSQTAVEFRFSAPFPAFPYHLPWSGHITDDALIQPVGAGAFLVTDWVRGDHVRLRKFADYYDRSLPMVEEVVARFAPSSAERIRAIEAGEVDVVEGVPAAAAESLRSRGLLQTASTRSSRKAIMAFNCRSGPLADVRVRKAIAHALDRNWLRGEVTGNNAQAIEASFPSSDPWAAEVVPYAFDRQRARTLLAEAGFADGVRVYAISTAVAPTPRVAELVAQQLHEVGVELSIQAYDDPPWWPFVYLGTKWDIAFQNFPQRPHPDTLFQRDHGTNGAFNGTGYSNVEFDRVVAEARSQTNSDRALGLFKDAQQILHDDLPILPLFSSDIVVGWRPGIVGVGAHPLQYVDLTETRIDSVANVRAAT